MNTPLEVVKNYLKIGKTKTNLPFLKMLGLGFFAGAFIALAGLVSTAALVPVKAEFSAKLVKACVFPLGLATVVHTGSELFTGNCLLVMPLLNGSIKLKSMLKNWAFVYIGNLIGSVFVTVVCACSNFFSLYGKKMAESVVATAQGKVDLSFGNAFFKGILCNILVCLAVWLSFYGKNAFGKTVALFFPVMLFVLRGYEHSVANMYYIPAGILAAKKYGILTVNLNFITFFTKNLIPVTLGNIIGGSIIAVIYWFVYLKSAKNN